MSLLSSAVVVVSGNSVSVAVAASCRVFSWFIVKSTPSLSLRLALRAIKDHVTSPGSHSTMPVYIPAISDNAPFIL